MSEPVYQGYADGRRLAIIFRDTADDAFDPCPFCKGRHTHGAGDGHRLTHCGTGEFSEMVELGGVVLKKSDGYIIRTRRKI
jgi:hypothetical protein